MKIVVVEDEKSIRNGLSNMLPRISPDYQVVGAAANGVEGMEVIFRSRPDLVIMDIQMPEMDGLTMLSRLRDQGVHCKVIVLTAYSDFAYAKRAIELGIENYLLKPIKIPELQKTLASVEKVLAEEKGAEKLQEWELSLEQLFRGSILAELTIDDELNRITKEKYGLDAREPLAMFAVWLGEHYDHNVGTAQRILEEYTGRVGDYQRCIIRFSRYQMIGLMIYQIKDAEIIRKRFEDAVVSVLGRALPRKTVYGWMECAGLQEVSDAFNELLTNRMWNLSFPDGTLISPQLILETELTPLKYPLDMEAQIRQAVAERNPISFERVIRYFTHSCRDVVHHPDEIREVAVRCCLSILSLGRAIGKVKEPVSAQNMVGHITQAVTWDEIWEVVSKLYQAVIVEEETDTSVSPLIKRARSIIEEYYNQGITLEELAQKLCVSEEYLSSQFKKETGVSFKDTVKKYRIDKIKELLLHSNLKRNQIADMVGYSDPKYMSKVFKEEVGMLPADFRKSGQ